MFENYDINKREITTFDVVITLHSPMSHIGETTGNQSNLKTLTVTGFEGPREVFAYSGNALRNGLIRRRGVKSFLEKLNLQVRPAVHQTLFAGGYIDGGTGNDLELDKRIRQLLPPISVLGTAKPKDLFGSKTAQMVEGRIKVGDAILVCYESAEYVYNFFPPSIDRSVLPILKKVIEAKKQDQDARIQAWLTNQDTTPDTGTDYIDLLKEYLPFLESTMRTYPQWLTWNQRVRMDSLKSPELQSLIAQEPSRGQLNLLTPEKPEKPDKTDIKQQMIMGDWLLQAGAKLYSRWVANITSIEMGFVADALLEFAKSPYLGGKSGTGCGLVAVDIYASNTKNSPWLSISPTAQIVSDGAQSHLNHYYQYIQEYQEFLSATHSDITGFLGI